MNIEPSSATRRVYRKITPFVLLILLVLVGGVVFLAMTLPPASSDGPDAILLTYSEQRAKCTDKIHVYRDGRIVYYCEYKEFATDTVPADKMARLLDAATRLPTGTNSNLTIPYNLSFNGSGHQPNTADHDEVQKISHELLSFMRQKYN